MSVFNLNPRKVLSPLNPKYLYEDYKAHNKPDDPSAAAREMEAARQTRVNAAIAAINGMFDTTTTPRQKLYDDQKTAVFDINKRDIGKQFSEAQGKNTAWLARSGLLGGSADTVSNQQLQDRNSEGLIKAGGIADQAAADLKTADERTRLGLISQAEAGLDATNAQQAALRGLDATAQSAAANRAGATVGDLFSNLGKAYVNNQTVAGLRSGLLNGSQLTGVVASPYQTYTGT